MFDYGWFVFGVIVITITPILGLGTAAWAASKRTVRDYGRFVCELVLGSAAFMCGYYIWTIGSLAWWSLPIAILALASATKIVKIGLREVRYS